MARIVLDGKEKSKLRAVNLVKEPARNIVDGDHYFLDVTYEYENESGVYLLRYPRVSLPFLHKPIITETRSMYDCEERLTVDLGFGDLSVSNFHDEFSGQTYPYIVKCIKEKTHKMTVSEIEKKLGYKIEIVSEK